MDCVDFDTLEVQAYDAMSPGAAAFCACGADDEITCRENREAWRAVRLRPRVLRDVSNVDTSAVLLGAKHAMPIMVAPMGRHKLFHDEGENASALGAAKAGAPYVLATNATVSIETVAAQLRASSQWFHLYLTNDRSGVEALLERVEQAEFKALVLTVDQPVSGSSPRAARQPIPPSDDIRHVNLPGQPIAATSYDPSMARKVTLPHGRIWSGSFGARHCLWSSRAYSGPTMPRHALRPAQRRLSFPITAAAIWIQRSGQPRHYRRLRRLSAVTPRSMLMAAFAAEPTLSRR